MRIVAMIVVALYARDLAASCKKFYPEPIAIAVVSCTPVEPAKLGLSNLGSDDLAAYAGVVLVGVVDGAQDTVWVPASANLACATVRPRVFPPSFVIVSGTQHRSCCDGDPNPPCGLHTSSVLVEPVTKRLP